MEITKVYRLRIEIQDSNPIVFRTITIPCVALFEDLHDVIQELFGWMDYHLYQFNLDDKKVNIYPDEDEDRRLNGKVMRVADDTTLFEYLNKGDTFDYIYDMGDYWVHNIRVEDELEQDEDYPKLLDFQGDNLAEDAGGILGYYEKLKYLEKNNHPDVDIRDWFEMQHIAFDPEEVKEELEMLFSDEPDFFDEAPFDENMERFESLFDIVLENSLVRLHVDKKTYYVYFYQGERNSIHIFDHEENCKMACLMDLEHVLPLYYEGIMVQFPDYDALEDDEEYFDPSQLHPEFIRVSARNDFEPLTYEDTEEIEMLLQYLEVIKSVFEDEEDFLPTIEEDGMCLDVTIDEKGNASLEPQEFDRKPTLPAFTFTQEEKDRIHTKVNTDRITFGIFPIKNLLDLDLKQEIVYYLLLEGKKTHEKIRLSGVLLEDIVIELKDFWVSYLEKHGCPKLIISDDKILISMMSEFFSTLKIKCKVDDFIMKKFGEMYQEAFQEVNNENLIDGDFMERIVHFDENSFEEFFEESKEKDFEKLLRYMAFLKAIDQ